MSSTDRAPVHRDPHAGPVPAAAWHTDELARARGRVAMFNATRPDGLDGWTMDLSQYTALRELILDTLAHHPEGMLLKDLVTVAQDRFGHDELFPGGRLRNYCTFTKVDLEARQEIERVPGRGPQRLRRSRHSGSSPAEVADIGQSTSGAAQRSRAPASSEASRRML